MRSFDLLPLLDGKVHDLSAPMQVFALIRVEKPFEDVWAELRIHLHHFLFCHEVHVFAQFTLKQFRCVRDQVLVQVL